MELTIKQVLQQGVAAHNAGNLQEAERAYQAILQSQPKHPDANHNLGLIAISVNEIEAALALFKTALNANPKVEQYWMSYVDALVKSNQVKDAKQAIKKARKKGFDAKRLQALLSQSKVVTDNKVPAQELLNNLLGHYRNGRFSEAEKLSVKITQDFPKHPLAWKVLGAVLGATGRNYEALDANRTAVALSPQDAEAHSNLGIMLTELGRLDEAEENCKQAVALQPDLAEVHSNLGNTLRELGRLDEAEASYNQALALNPDYAEALNNLGVTLQELGRLDEAESSYIQAIALKPDFALAHYGLGKVLYIKGYEDLALESIVKASEIEPQSRDYELMLRVMEARKSRKEDEAAVRDTITIGTSTGLISNPLILNRSVEEELVTSLYEINSIQLDKTKRVGLLPSGKIDARYGNGVVSPDFNLFKIARPIIQKVAGDLTRIMMEAVRSEIYIYDSFFNILRAGGGTTPHTHLASEDKNIALDLGSQKYSLVYYLSVGDQNCSEPGILRLYEPGEDILPSEGMITIIPASRNHSAVYGGKTDRIMIGANFYSL